MAWPGKIRDAVRDAVPGVIEPPHYVYVFLDRYAGRFKIGFSEDPMRRMQSIGLPDLVLYMALPVVDRAAAKEKEKKLHRHFSCQRIGNSEWFYLGKNLRYQDIPREFMMGASFG